MARHEATFFLAVGADHVANFVEEHAEKEGRGFFPYQFVDHCLADDGRLFAMEPLMVVAIHGDYDPHPADGLLKLLAAVLEDFRFTLLKNCGHVPWMERKGRGFYKILREELRSENQRFAYGRVSAHQSRLAHSVLSLVEGKQHNMLLQGFEPPER